MEVGDERWRLCLCVIRPRGRANTTLRSRDGDKDCREGKVMAGCDGVGCCGRFDCDTYLEPLLMASRVLCAASSYRRSFLSSFELTCR